MRNPFKRELTLNRVRDHVTIREGNDTLTLTVDSEATALITRILAAQKVMNTITAESSQLDREGAAIAFSSAIFGKEQTSQLFDFYKGNADCVVTICGMYFGDTKNGLGKKITKVQKRLKK